MLQSPFQVLLFCGLLLAPAPAAAQAQCNGVAGLIASLVKNVPEAQTLCSTRFPQPSVTTTIPAQTVRVTSTAQNTLTAATLTVTETAPEVTTTATVSTNIITETTTTTVTADALKKREPQVSANGAAAPRSSSSTTSASSATVPGSCGNQRECAIQTLRSALPALASSVCKCIQAPRTVTATPAAVTSTILTTVAVTETPAAFTNTITPTKMLSVTLTTTTTIVATVTSTPAPYAGPPRCDFNSQSGCSSNCQCDPLFSGTYANQGFCWLSGSQLGAACSTHADCGESAFCDTDFGRCLSNRGCTSTYVPSKTKRAEGMKAVSARDVRVKNKQIGNARITFS